MSQEFPFHVVVDAATRRKFRNVGISFLNSEQIDSRIITVKVGLTREWKLDEDDHLADTELKFKMTCTEIRKALRNLLIDVRSLSELTTVDTGEKNLRSLPCIEILEDNLIEALNDHFKKEENDFMIEDMSVTSVNVKLLLEEIRRDETKLRGGRPRERGVDFSFNGIDERDGRVRKEKRYYVEGGEINNPPRSYGFTVRE